MSVKTQFNKAKLNSLLLISLTTSCAHNNNSRQRETASTPSTKQTNASDTYLNFSESKFRVYKNGVFEVVVPWDNKSQVQYEEKLPYDKLPFHMRKDPYFSVGTAFAVSPSVIVSAAHVFDAHKLSLFTQQIKLRGTNGKIYEIDKVIRYSQHRDLIGITLKSYPASLRPLKASTKTKVGELVYAVGNALGQGVVVRDGRIASYTPEEVNGDWDFIRFTAPASPGNSGGALLNQHGKVIGVVVRRSENENLNYAVPIREFVKLPSKHATFYDADWGEFEAGKSLRTPWVAQIGLPQELNQFQTLAHQAFINSFKKRRIEFEKKYASDLYPLNKKFNSWLSEQAMSFRFTEIKPDTNGNWHSFAVETQESRIAADQRVYVGARKNSDYLEFYIERPKNLSLEKFYNNPQLTTKAFIDTIDFKREFASNSIKIKSLGKPKSNQWWRDELGRSWRTTKWPISYMDGFFVSHCLPMPKGMACRMSFPSTWEEPLRDYYTRINSKRLGISYIGRIKDWNEFVRLPQKYRPTFFNEELKMNLSKNKFNYKIGQIKGLINDSTITTDSEISIGVGYDIKNPKQLSIFKVITKPNPHKSTAYGSEYVYKPDNYAPKKFKNRWKEISQLKAPFDGKTRLHSGGHQTFHPVSFSTRAPASSKNKKLIYSCYHEDTVTKIRSNKLCQQFKNQSLKSK